jgi:hypothetical protein
MIIIGTDFRLQSTLNRSLVSAIEVLLTIEPPHDATPIELAATITDAALGTVYADISAAQNVNTGEQRVWAQVTYPGNIVYKSPAKTFSIWEEGFLQIV